jgi:hypothetical protein
MYQRSSRVRPRVVAVASVLGLSLMSLSAFAQVQAIAFQSGAACSPHKNDVAKTNYSVSRGIVNESTSAEAQVYCPFVFQPEDFGVGPPIVAQLTIFDENGNSGKDVTCTFNGVSTDGSVIHNEVQATSGSATFPLSLFFSPQDSWLTYTARCTLPRAVGTPVRQSRIISYGFDFGD